MNAKCLEQTVCGDELNRFERTAAHAHNRVGCPTGDR